MKNLNTYSLAGLALAFFLVGSLFGKFTYKVMKKDQEDINYVMPRPHNSRWSLDLSGRTVTRSMKEAYQRIKPPPAPAPVAAAPVAPAATAAPAAKKAADKTAKKDAATETKTAATSTTDKDKTKSATGDSGWSPSDSPASAGAYVAPPKTPEAQSYNEWRNQILGDLSVVTVNKFIAEYNAHRVDPDTFYRVIDDLLLDHREQAQMLGLYVLNAVPNPRSFGVTAQASEELQGAPRAQAGRVLASYTQSDRVNYLEGALGSDDQLVLKKATEVLIVALRKEKSSSAGNISRSGRGVSAQTVASAPSSPSQDWDRFVPALQRIVDLADSTVSPLANTALRQLERIQIQSTPTEIPQGSRST